MRTRVWEVVSVANPGDRTSLYFDLVIMALIALNVAVVVVGTVPYVEREFATLLFAFELVSVAVFSVEYVLRVWSCVEDPRYSRGGRLRFALTPLAIVDLLAVLPFYLPFFGVDLRVLRVLRLLRIFRIAKLGRYLPAFLSLRNVIIRKKEELLLSFSVLAMLLIVAASLMFYAENEAQPEVFSSIPATMWWAVATLTTVGYGDVYPVTAIGRVLASAAAILGIGLFALPAGILASGLQEELEALKERRRLLKPETETTDETSGASGGPTYCPHCGEKL